MERLNTTRLIHNEPVEATEEKQIVEFFDEQDFMGWLNKQNEIIEWKYHKQIRSSTQSTSPGTLQFSTKKLGRRPTFEWTKVYLCPFNGKPKTFKGFQNARKPTKASQRVGCKASLRVQKKFDSEKITVTIKGAHSGHILRSNDTWQKMRMTPEVRKWLAKSVATGVGWKGFKKTYRPNQQQSEMLLAKNLLKNAPVQASDMLRVSNMDFNNFRRKQLKLTAQLDPDCWNSLQKYVDLIRKEGGIATIEDVPEDRVGNRSVFMFAFCTSWQTDVFRKYTSLLCLDSTHNTCYALNDKGRKAFLYSIVVKHDEGGCGIPVAFMITSSETQRPLARWLMWLKQILPLHNTPIFMIDCSSTEMAAIGSVFIRPEIRLCYWHMLRAMRSQANNKISSPLITGENLNSRSRKDRSSQIRESAMGDFVKLIHTETVDKFGDAWAAYQVKYSGYEEWMIYLSSNWLCQAEKWWSGNRYNMLDINTNNLIESWHRSLKTEYLGSVRKQRIDLLVYILLEDVLPDFCVKVGRIINGLDNRRRSDTEQKQLALSVALTNEIASSFIRQEAVPRGCDHYSKALSCRSFEKEEVRYDIELNSCLAMTSCTCLYMKKRKSVCKHMFLARRVLGFSICFDTRVTEEIIADDQNDTTSAQDYDAGQSVNAQGNSLVDAGQTGETNRYSLVHELELMIPVAKRYDQMQNSQQENCDNLAEHMAAMRRDLGRGETLWSTKQRR